MKDALKIKGNFQMKAYDVDGNLLWEYEDDNLVVTTGRASMANLLGAATAPNKHITHIHYGTNGADPVLSDTAITAPFAKAVDAVSYPAPGSVQFDFSLGLTENNGVTIREYGLISADTTLFARKTRAPIVKDNTISLTGTWTITI